MYCVIQWFKFWIFAAFFIFTSLAKDQDSKDSIVGQLVCVSLYSPLANKECRRFLHYTLFFIVLSSHWILHQDLPCSTWCIATIMRVHVLCAFCRRRGTTGSKPFIFITAQSFYSNIVNNQAQSCLVHLCLNQLNHFTFSWTLVLSWNYADRRTHTRLLVCKLARSQIYDELKGNQ